MKKKGKKGKSLRVLLPVHVFFPDHIYGTETYTLELARSLRRLGHEASILTAVPWGEEGPGELLSSYVYDDFPVHVIDLNGMPNRRFKDTYYRPELNPLFRKVLGEVRPDLVHVTHLINHTGSLLEAVGESRIPAVATLTDFFGFCFNNKLEAHDGSLCLGPDRFSSNCLACYLRRAGAFPLRRAVKPWIRRDRFVAGISRLLPFLIRVPGLSRGALAGHVLDVTARRNTLLHLYGNYRALIAPTEFLYRAYGDNGFYPERLRKIHFGISQELVRGFDRPRKNGGGPVRFGYIGQITAHKGVDLLVDAFLRLGTKNATLTVYGPGDQDRPYMDALRKAADGAKGVSFRDPFPPKDLTERLAGFDVLVIPSRWYENSPLVLLYGLATRTPVVVTDVEGMNEFVRYGENGFTFRKNDRDHLTAVLRKFTDDPRWVEILSRNASYRKDVEDHAREVVAVYESVLRGGRS